MPVLYKYDILLLKKSNCILEKLLEETGTSELWVGVIKDYNCKWLR